jgi:predicted transcriptional regulator
MTARELLLREAPDWTEHDAEVALRAVQHEHDDPLLRAIANAPEDDEPWTEEDDTAVAEGRADLATGRTVSHEDMLRKYG